jgi:hypothetical protein
MMPLLAKREGFVTGTVIGFLITFVIGGMIGCLLYLLLPGFPTQSTDPSKPEGGQPMLLENETSHG